MQKTNRMMSLLLALGIMLSVALPIAASAATLTFSDVSSDYIYYSAITDLTAEGIINGFEDGTFKPEESVTRAQFTKIICYAQNVGDIKYSEADRAKFPDVVSTGADAHWAIDNITTAKNSGIINGYDDGTFKPENSVLYEQAVKMAVCALGYTEDRAERAGGTAGAYPQGYLNLASKAKLLDKIVGAKLGEPFSRGQVAQLINNMLNAEKFDSETGKTGGTLREDSSSTRSSAEGRIVAVYGTSIYYDEESECNKKQIELELNNGEREFYGIEDLNINDLNDYLGRSVTVYYEIESGADYYEAYNIAFQNKKNYEVTISMDDVEDFTNNKLEYMTDEDDEIEKISIASDIAIIHNGQAVNEDFGDVIDEYYNKSGSLTLVCSLNNDTADVAFIKTYETIVVNSIDRTNYKIYDYYDSSRMFVLDETDRSKTITFTKDGKASTFSGITTNSIVSVSTSSDGKLIDVQISTKTPKGTVTDMQSDDKIKLDSSSTYYRFADSCDRSDDVDAGMYVTLYLDAFGKIARYVVSAAKAYTYGYLASLEEGSMTDPKVEVMVYKLSSSNTTLTDTIYKLSEKVKIDGKTYNVTKDSSAVVKALENAADKTGINAAIDGTAPENAQYSQPIRFTTSSSSVIDSILTNQSTGENNVSMNMVSHVDDPLECLSDKTTLGQYKISSSTPIILVPSDRLNGTYMTKNYNYFKKGESYYVQFANNTSTNQPGAVYVYGTSSSGSDVTTEVLTEDDMPMVVKEIATVMYQNESRKVLRLIRADGESVEVYDDDHKDTEAVKTVSVGDIVRIAADGDSFVDAIEVLAKAEDVVSGKQDGFVKFAGTSDGKDDISAPFRVVLGLTYSVDGDSFVLAPSFDVDTELTKSTYTYDDSVKIYLIDSSNTNNMVQTSTYGEVVGYNKQQDNASKIMVYTNDSDLKAIYIFK